MFACEEHLKNLKKIKSQHGDLISKDARVDAEMEIDSLISQMIATFDCLLLRIIDNFQLSGIPRDRMEFNKVVSALSAESKGVELAGELQKANQEDNWYWMLKHLRNYSLSGSLLSPEASLDVIPFFEQAVVQLKELIKNNRMSESK
jgi:hypothetical protein